MTLFIPFFLQKGVAAVKSTTDPKVEQILKESELVLLGIKNG